MPLISEKTRKFLRGRRGLLSRVEAACKGQDNIIWVHSASYGEFEEVRPVIAEIRKAAPGKYKFLVTFFSPSGYEHLKDDPTMDWVFYLPYDTPWAARRFLDAVRPVKMIFCITDFWLCFVGELRRRGIDTYVVSARFQEGMSYFKWFGKPYLKAFKGFRRIFVNNEESLQVLQAHGVGQCLLAGDPRMDRVLSLAAEQWSDPVVDEWAAGDRVFVGGSVLPDMDIEIMAALAKANPKDKFLLVPHEVGEKEVGEMKARFASASLYTDSVHDGNVLIVNIVGVLSRIYRYGFAAYVGAGFDGAPHSIIEPAAYGVPVAFGPQFGPVWHCRRMIDAGCGFALNGVSDALEWYGRMKSDASAAGAAARAYCLGGSGVAARIAASILAD